MAYIYIEIHMCIYRYIQIRYIRVYTMHIYIYIHTRTIFRHIHVETIMIKEGSNTDPPQSLEARLIFDH